MQSIAAALAGHLAIHRTPTLRATHACMLMGEFGCYLMNSQRYGLQCHVKKLTVQFCRTPGASFAGWSPWSVIILNVSSKSKAQRQTPEADCCSARLALALWYLGSRAAVGMHASITNITPAPATLKVRDTAIYLFLTLDDSR